MSKTGLNRRISNLEKTLHSGREWYVSITSGFSSISYAILSLREMNPGDYAGSAGPFKTFQEARQWSLQDVENRFPNAYQRLLKERSMPELLREKWLCADVMIEFLNSALAPEGFKAWPAEGWQPDSQIVESYQAHRPHIEALKKELEAR